MSIEKDQAELRAKNKAYLKKLISEYFATAFAALEMEYKAKIQNDVFDPLDSRELNQFIRREFEQLRTSAGVMFFSGVEVENKRFIFDPGEIERTETFRGIVDNIYPPLEKQLKSGRPEKFTRLLRSLKYTTCRIYLKYLADTTSNSLNGNKPKAVEVAKPVKTCSAKYQNLFKPWGFECFQYLDENFTGVTPPEPRYTLLYYFLHYKGILKGTAKDYREMVRKETPIKIKFARLSVSIDGPRSQIYINNYDFLRDCYTDFCEKNKITFK